MTSPFTLIAATEEEEDCQVNPAVTGWMLPSVYTTLTEYCNVVPLAMEAVAGVRCNEAGAADVI